MKKITTIILLLVAIATIVYQQSKNTIKEEKRKAKKKHLNPLRGGLKIIANNIRLALVYLQITDQNPYYSGN